MNQRTKFIADYLRECFSIIELCERYGVARRTGSKLIDRYLRYGPTGREERSRRPHRSPNETDPEFVVALLKIVPVPRCPKTARQGGPPRSQCTHDS